MTIAAFDCRAGASGDMLLGSLLDLLTQKNLLSKWKECMSSVLEIEAGGRAEIQSVERHAHAACKVDFFIGERPADEGLAVRSGHTPHLHHAHRHMKHIRKILADQAERGLIPDAALRLAERIFLILGNAEAKAHDCDLEKVHFHEVGAYDSIMDIVGFCVAYSLLGIEDVTSTPVMLGSGKVDTAHGLLDVPTPAVEEIRKAYPFPTTDIQEGGECLTPTGAAILAATVNRWEPSPEKGPAATWGCGAGTRNPAHYANMVRVALS